VLLTGIKVGVKINSMKTLFHPVVTVVVLVMAFIIGVLAKPTQPPNAIPINRGEINVQREMPKARKEFGAGTEADYDRFIEKVFKFEQPGGFDSEAEIEASRRVLNVPRDEVDNIFNYLRKAR
jgi:hypothetical protein